MGSTQSTGKNAAHLSLPFNKSYSPSFYYEKNLAHFIYSVKSNNQIKDYELSKLNDLVSIIIGRPDRFNQEEISSLLENIIEYYVLDTPVNPNEEHFEFSNAISIIDDLNTRFNSLSNYRKMGYNQFSSSNQEEISELEHKLNCSTIIRDISPLIEGNFDKKSKNIVNQTSNEIKSLMSCRIANTPMPDDFLPKNVDSHIFDFNNNNDKSTSFVKSLGCRGLTTNGQYIFLLSTPNLLFVFPILNNGILMLPKLINLPINYISSEKDGKSQSDILKEEAFELPTQTCITSFPNYVEIHSFVAQQFKRIKIDMNKIIPIADFQPFSEEKNKDDQSKLYYETTLEFQDLDLADSSPNLIKVTNGVIYVNVQKFRKKENEIYFICEIYDAKSEKLIKKVQLCANNQQENNNLNSNLHDLFPDVSYNKIPIETNGSTISFIFEKFGVYRTFSLITGEFLKDEELKLFNNPASHIIASTIDSVNNCRWILTNTEDNKACIQKMQYHSSIDPYIFHIEDIHYSNKITDILISFNHLLRYYCCSLNPPSFLICDNIDHLLSLLNIAVKKKDLMSVQSLCMIVSLNMMKMERFENELVKKIFELLNTSNIEIGLQYLLFFPNFQKFIRNEELKNDTTNKLFYLLQANNVNDSLFSYALRAIENCDEFGTLSLLSLDDSHANLLQLDQILSVYIIHQRIIVRNALNMIDGNEQYKNQNKNTASPVSNLRMYLHNLQTHFQSELAKCKKNQTEFDDELLNKFVDTPIYKLFHNFIRLLTPLAKFHEIASIADNIFKMILKDYIRIPFSNPRIRMNLLETCYVYGLILSSLISGGIPTPFEKKFNWVIPSNINLINDKNKLNELGGQPNENENDKFSLDILYKKIKPGLNKNLSEDMKRLDKCVIRAIALHMNCYDELVRVCSDSNAENVETSSELRKSFIQMQQCRDFYRNSLQNKREDESKELFDRLLSKAQLLCQIKSDTLVVDDLNSKSKILGEFIQSPFTTEYIKEVFKLQKSRFSAAQNGFPLLNDVFKKDKNQYMKEIIGHVLKKYLTSFGELNSILQLEGDKLDLNSSDISLFFNGVYPISSDFEEKAPEARIIPYRFFKSIKIFPNIFETLLCNQLKLLGLHSNDAGIYALTVSLVSFSEKLPTDKFQEFLSSYIKVPTNAFKLSLVENIINKASDDFVYSDEFLDSIFGNSLLTSPINIRIVNRIRYQLVRILMNEKLDNYLNEYLLFIGQHLFDIDNYHSLLVSSYIALLRKVILHAIQNETSPIRKATFYEKLMNSTTNADDESKEANLLGLYAICGYQMETVNPYSTVSVTLNSNVMKTYLIIQGENFLKESDSQFNLALSKCFEICPFNISKEPIQYSSFPRNSLITVDPEVSFNNDIFTEKVKKMLMDKQILTDITFPVCAQALLNFYMNNSKIITSEDQNMIDYMCTMITPFNDIYNTNDQIKKFKSLKIEDNETNKFKILPELTPQFGVIEDHLSTTYLSLPINNDSSEFEVNLEITDDDKILSNSKIDLFHFGVASDAVNEEEIRISTIGFPSGISFPEKEKVCDINFSESTCKISFFVNPKTRKISLQSNEIDFPIGRKFRLVIFKKKSTKLTFNPIVKEEVFDANGTPDLDKLISLKKKPTEQEDYEDYNYLKFPDFIEEEQILKPDFRQYEGVDKFTHEMDLIQKLRLMTVHHPMNPVLHLSNSRAASQSIIDHHLKGLFNKLGRQWLTVLLLKITSNDPSLISKYAFELFSLFSVPIEIFNQDEFNQGHFPFSLERPPWESTTVLTSSPKEKMGNTSYYTLVANDMMNALSVMIKNSDCMDQIAEGLFRMSTSSNLHQIALPQKYHSFYYIKEGSDSNVINLSIQSIIALNNYEGIQKNVAYMINEDDETKTYYDLPYIFKSDSQMSQLYVNNDKSRGVSILEVNSSNSSFKNDWIVDTPIELLVHLKNFSFAAKKDNHLSLVKTILLNLYLSKSPFTIPYIHQFQNFAQMELQTTLFYKDELYIKSLIALGNFLKSKEIPDEYYVNLYESEQPMISNKATIEEAAHFPEFFPPNAKFPEVTTDTVTITNAIINPGSIKSGFQSRILTIKQCFEEQKSLIGIPFWDILPYWNRIVEIFGFDDQKMDDSELNDEEYNEIFPLEVVQLKGNVCKVSNLTDDEFNVKLVFNKKLPDEELKKVLFEYSNNYSFNGLKKYNWTTFDNPITIGKGSHFFCIKEVPSDNKPWESLCSLKVEPIKEQPQVKDRPETKTIKVTDDYKNEFIRSMKSFFFDWKPANTEELLNIFNLDDLRSPSFKAIANVVLNSNLSLVFPKTVVLLRALLLHHFNYIQFSQNKNQVSKFLWNSCSNLIPILEKSAELSKLIAVVENNPNQLTIDQKASLLLINDFRNITAEINNNQTIDELSPVEKRANSTISQWAKFVKSAKMDNLKGKHPLKIKIKNAITVEGTNLIDGTMTDGLLKNFLNEASDSIFQPSTQLFMKANCKEEYFIPETRKRIGSDEENEKIILNEYYSIGVLIGIISRVSYPQCLPFAPFIWKFIAGEQITPDDIAEVDDNLSANFKSVRNKEVPPSWTANSWLPSSSSVQLIGGAKNSSSCKEDEDEEIIRYLNEYTKYRLHLIEPQLIMIRDGFVDNTELNSNPLLSGKVLSYLAQGTGDLTVEMLKSIEKVFNRGPQFNKVVEFFWEAVEEFNKEEIKMLLKFITGVTRIPKISEHGNNFHINIMKMNCKNPDSQLPTAQSCFNKIALPMYSSKEVAKERILFAIKNCLTLEIL